jgi:hypothetical protein
MSKDCKRRGAMLGSATGDALGIHAESDDLTRDRRLCRELESGQSELYRAGGRMLAAPPTFWGIDLAGHRSMRLEGARYAGRHTRTGHLLVFSGGASRLTRA